MLVTILRGDEIAWQKYRWEEKIEERPVGDSDFNYEEEDSTGPWEEMVRWLDGYSRKALRRQWLTVVNIVQGDKGKRCQLR